MRKLSFILGVITIAASFAFLYFGVLIPSLNTTVYVEILGMSFVVSFVISAILLLIINWKDKKYSYFIMILLCFFSWVGHILITKGFQFTPAYSYAMDVFIAVIYLIYLSRNFENIFCENKKSCI